MVHENERNLCRRRQKEVDHYFSIPYTEHNKIVKDGALK